MSLHETEGRPGGTPDPKGAERRRHPRVAVDWPVTISLADGQYQARLRDVSRAGVCFFLDRRIPEMTILRMQLALPTGSPGEEDPSSPDNVQIEGEGVVVRCQALSPHLDHYEVAVFLNDLPAEQRKRLDTYLESRATG
jgi:hypothetical protein